MLTLTWVRVRDAPIIGFGRLWAVLLIITYFWNSRCSIRHFDVKLTVYSDDSRTAAGRPKIQCLDRICSDSDVPLVLTCSRRFTHICGHPSAAGRAQIGESSPAKDQRFTAVPHHQPVSVVVVKLWSVVVVELWDCCGGRVAECCGLLWW